MKKFLLGSLFTMCGLFMTSCLDEGSNQEEGVSYGVVATSSKTAKKIIYSNRIGPSYSARVADDFNIYPGDCCQFSYILDYDIPENSADAVTANGYYTISIIDYVSITKYSVSPSLTDTTTFSSNELTVNSISLSYSTIIDDKVFLATLHDNFLTDQKQTFEMSYDSNQEPEVINGKNVYNLFLRVVKKEDGKSPTITLASAVNAFDMKYFISNFKNKEKNAGSKYLSFRFNYINSLDDEKTKAVWNASETVDYLLSDES